MKVHSKLLKNPDGRTKYKKFTADGREHFHIAIWVSGTNAELHRVEKVNYELHFSFKNEIRTSKTGSDNFLITFWTWGMFKINVKIYKSNGKEEEISHPLKFKLPPDNGKNYIDVSELEQEN